MNKRVGIITLYNNNNNYGGIAQSYATQKYISSLGYDCTIINYKRSKTGCFNIPTIKLKGWKRIINAVVRRIELVGEYFLCDKIETRKQYFAKSRDMIPHTKVYDESNIQKCNNDFDVFVSGSDQIWKPYVMQLPYVLNFVESNKVKISYASSISQTNLSNEYAFFMKKHLESYTAISVREVDAQEYLSSVTGRMVKWVVDPVLLLSEDEWQELCVKRRLVDEPYVFCYLLGDRKEERKWVERFSKINKRKLVVLPHVEGRCRIFDIGFGDLGIYNAGVPEFLTLIRDADYVVTDSFHAVVFSYLMKKQFFALPRRNKNSDENMSSRLTSVLTQMGLLHRMIDIGKSAPDLAESNHIDYNNLDSKIEEQIELSKQFLKTNLAD